MNFITRNEKIFVFLLLLFFIVNIVAAGFIFLDIQIISAPKVSVNVDILEINSEDMLLEATIYMQNPNSFQLSLSDFEMVSLSEDNEEIGRLEIEGGLIDSDSDKTFVSSERMDFMGEDFVIIKNRIIGVIGVKLLGFIEKSIPVDLEVVTSLEEIMENLKPPEINMVIELENLSKDGLGFSVAIDFYNPNSIGLNIKEFSVIAETDEGEKVGNIEISGGLISPKSSSGFKSTGNVMFKAIDAKKLTFKLNGVASINIAGMKKTISISTENEVVIPDLTEFVFQNDFVDIKIPVQFKLRLRGIKSNVGFKITNPSNIPIIGEKLVCGIYRVDKDKMTLLGEKELDSCKISPHSEVCVKTEIIIPYRTFFFYGGIRPIPEWIVLKIDGKLSIAGTRQYLPLSLNAYVDLHLFKNKNVDQLD